MIRISLYMVCPVLKENRRTVGTHFYIVYSVCMENRSTIRT